MSTLSGMIRYALRDKPKKKENWLPKDKWIAKMKREGKWVDYSKKKR